MLYLVKVEMLDCLSHWDVPVIAKDPDAAKDAVRPTLRADEYIWGVEPARVDPEAFKRRLTEVVTSNPAFADAPGVLTFLAIEQAGEVLAELQTDRSQPGPFGDVPALAPAVS